MLAKEQCIIVMVDKYMINIDQFVHNHCNLKSNVTRVS